MNTLIGKLVRVFPFDHSPNEFPVKGRIIEVPNESNGWCFLVQGLAAWPRSGPRIVFFFDKFDSMEIDGRG